MRPGAGSVKGISYIAESVLTRYVAEGKMEAYFKMYESSLRRVEPRIISSLGWNISGFLYHKKVF